MTICLFPKRMLLQLYHLFKLKYKNVMKTPNDIIVLCLYFGTKQGMEIQCNTKVGFCGRWVECT